MRREILSTVIYINAPGNNDLDNEALGVSYLIGEINIELEKRSLQKIKHSYNLKKEISPFKKIFAGDHIITIWSVESIKKEEEILLKFEITLHQETHK